jgi:hypothetical protein
MVEAEVRSKSSLWYSIAALAAILPAIGTAVATRGVINAFRGIALTGSGGVGTVSVGLYEANRPLIVAAVAAAALAAWLAVVVLRKPQAFPGLPLSLAPLLALVPAFFLWMVESSILEVIDPNATGGSATDVADVSQRLARLVTASFGGAIAVIAIAIVLFVVSLTRSRPTDSALPPLPPAAVWATVTVLLIGLAAAFYMRSSYLYQVGQTGQL